ncbi:MAG: sulfurtransferase TusA family protein, partial [Pseudomonadota bacterium]
LLCPLPVLKARKRLQPLKPGEVLEVLADDPAAVVDIPHFCAEQGHALLDQRPADEGATLYRIRKDG